jgi:hypothetical protein
MSPWNEEYDDLPRAGVEPKTTTAKVIGILNIVFASLLLLCGLCMGFYVLIFSSMGPLMAGQQPQLQKRLEQLRQDQIRKLEAEEQAAATDQEKRRIREQIRLVQAQPIKIPDMSKLLGDQRVWGFYLVDVLTGLILNVAMLVAGIGLVCLSRWGRTLGIWVAAIKILRLVVLYGLFIVVIVPIQTQQIIAFFEEIEKTLPPGGRGGAAATRGDLAAFGAMMTGYAIGLVITGVIYPIIALILLTRPGVGAACSGARPEPYAGPRRPEDYLQD